MTWVNKTRGRYAKDSSVNKKKTNKTLLITLCQEKEEEEKTPEQQQSYVLNIQIHYSEQVFQFHFPHARLSES